MKRLKSIVGWTIINGAYAGLVVYGGVYGATWAANLAAFGAWALLFIYAALFGVFVVSNVAIDEGKDLGSMDSIRDADLRSVPRFIRVTFDIAVVLALAALGWFVTAVVYALSVFVEACLRNSITSMQDKLKARSA